ncbi:hypothetical protein EG328_005606 [Venturia inaequalis]|uniref:Histidine kinase n=1 Tax=Venturia inaequalis TaxID=5025 RepID=A0A8H3VJH5_VENIN|nr:hypothetical protein EG328_005606 [Venturia inaequalis]
MLNQSGPHSESVRDRHESPDLASLGFLEAIALDPRPTLVLDLVLLTGQTAQSSIVHRNPALRSHFALNELISGRAKGHLDLEYIGFRDWIIHEQEPKKAWARPCARCFNGYSWTGYTVRSRYRVVSGVPEDGGDTATDASKSTAATPQLFPDSMPPTWDGEEDADSASIASTERYAFGCTDLSVPAKRFTPFVQFFRSVDWPSSTLGSMEDWPLQLHQMINFVMNDPTPAFVLWGKELSVIYNEAAIEVLLDRHPRVMGMPLQEVYPEVWDQVAILIHKVQRSGKAVRVENVPMLLNRRGRMDECFFSFQYQPIKDEKGTCLGIYESFNEVTKQNHAARRMSLLLAISTCSSVAKDMHHFWKLLLEALETSEALPFALLYTVPSLLDVASRSFDSAPNRPDLARLAELEGQIGLSPAHPTYIQELQLSATAPGYGSAMNEASETGEPVFLSTEEGTLPSEFVQNVDLRGVREPARDVVVWPITPNGLGGTVAFIIMGLNPHLGLDDELKSFLAIMQRQIATSAAAILLFEDEVRHREDVAKQLRLRTRELMKSEMAFQRISDKSMVGIILADLNGSIVYSNQAYRDITGFTGESGELSSWLALFPDEVADSLLEIWKNLLATREPIVAEFPLKKPWSKTLASGECLTGSTWILLSAFIDEDDDGTAKRSLTTITDISQQKWAEAHQTRRMEEAMELKRQQEAFVDMTSHEIRNPLSAIIQSADSISSSLASLFSYTTTPDSTHLLVLRTLLEDNRDSADTITLCAQHQQNVVNDILTLSKMDSDMLSVTPMDVEPLKIVGHVVKMFESESLKYGISVKIDVEQSFEDLGLHNVRLDPSRLTQVLVNILGNALKFTRLVVDKRIVIRIGGSTEDPIHIEKDIEYIPQQDTTIPAGFMNGASSPRTEVEYGGSGLGLFISKKLSELQGGGIGLASEPGQGSTFAFYVLAQRVAQPPPSSTRIPLVRNEEMIQGSFPEHRSAHLLTQPRPSPPVLTGAVPKSFPIGSAVIQRKLAILVVEDNLVNQRVLCKQLRNLGHIVYAANHGKEALEFLEKSTYWAANDGSGEHLDIILLDTEMPVMDGLTCARLIREAEREGKFKGHIPIVSVSANARSEQIEIARSVGMDEAISKPFRVADLIPKMDSLVGNYGS